MAVQPVRMGGSGMTRTDILHIATITLLALALLLADALVIA